LKEKKKQCPITPYYGRNRVKKHQKASVRKLCKQGNNKKNEVLMERKKVSGVITSKEYQELSNNYKFKIITSDRQELFFYSQQKHQGISQELTVNGKYWFYLFKGKKYWFLESREKAEETIKETPE